MAQCRLSEATELLQDLLRKKPGLRTAESLLAEALVEARRYDDAALIYERIVQAETSVHISLTRSFGSETFASQSPGDQGT